MDKPPKPTSLIAKADAARREADAAASRLSTNYHGELFIEPDARLFGVLNLVSRFRGSQDEIGRLRLDSAEKAEWLVRCLLRIYDIEVVNGVIG